MNRFIWLVCAVALLVTPHALMGQHRGNHGAGAGAGQTGAAPNDGLSDFKRAVALQASPEQVNQFQQLAKDTEVARKSSQDLSRSEPPQNAHALTDALDDAQTDNARFLEGFSPEQKAGLKELTKKLGKANSEVAKLNKALGGSGPSKDVVERLDKALAEVQADLSAIGKAMGIPGGSSSE